MSYWRYWQLNSAPFTGSKLFRGASVEEAFARIEFLVSNRRAVGSLTGISGVGKSAVLQHCVANPPIGNDIPNLEMIRTSLLGMASGELLVNLASRLSGQRRIVDSQSSWKLICDYFQAARPRRTANGSIDR